jgi:hypothetical protein
VGYQHHRGAKRRARHRRLAIEFSPLLAAQNLKPFDLTFFSSRRDEPGLCQDYF